ncbi:MAG TPA: DEAD/DEAH box helicase family protein [Sulfuricurvum sp.]|nr:DEAD/DEAH box helicase family protein [Sulfuricurvum sp.]
MSSSEDINKVFVSKQRTALNHFILQEDGVVLQDFTLFHHENTRTVDLLIFLPHRGLYVGEKILWKAEELQGAKIERFTRQSKKASSTQIESTEHAICRKLEDVLSFDSTPIERIMWMENLSQVEFESLDSSFHELLPKERLLFHDDSAAEIEAKLYALREHQGLPFSNLKVIGSLKAHTLLLPDASTPFGMFLSTEQQIFLDAPLAKNTVLTLSGDYGSGKSTVLIRKIIDYMLHYPHATVLIVTPTLISGELLRNEFVSIMEFAAVKCNLTSLSFYTPSLDNEPLETTRIFKEASLVAFDDAHLLPVKMIETVTTYKDSKSFLWCGVDLSDHDNKEASYSLNAPYRCPTMNTIHFAHTKGAVFTLLSGLKKHLETTSSNRIMIILPTHDAVTEYQKAIETHLHVKCRFLNTTYSLQYENLDEITLSTPQHISGLNVPHSYLINLNPEDPLYSLSLSRASETVTIISESILEG